LIPHVARTAPFHWHAWRLAVALGFWYNIIELCHDIEHITMASDIVEEAGRHRLKDPKKGLLDMPRLTVSLTEAQEQIDKQLDEGRELAQRTIRSDQELDEARSDLTVWDDYNKTLLQTLFDSSEPAGEYENGEPVGWVGTWGPTPLHQRVEHFRRDVKRSLTRLESVKRRLKLYEESSREPRQPEAEAGNRRVFVVHGRDEGSKESVARFLEHLDLDAIVLHEKPSAGRTIIEKFEEYSDVGYAVVILTPDDTCCTGKDEPTTHQPRQNVVFELGFFIGKLGRQRVCALFKEGTEIPSDYQGVVYVPMDGGGAWRLDLAREMKHAGMDVDLNKAL